jgi:hypothetical protein
LQLLQERLIQAGEALLAVQVFKRKPESEIQLICIGVHL